MSLLLDALKKAAEQKAEKNKQEVPQAGSSDETEIHMADEDASRLEGGVDSGLPQPERGLQDETEIDESEPEVRSERTLVEADDGTETRLEIPDTTETETRSFSAQMQTGEDETIIFAEDDVADFMGEPELVSRAPREPEDETDLSQLARREDATDVSEVAPQVAEDETDLSQLARREDATDVSEVAPQVAEDETDLSQLAPREDDTDISQPFPVLDEPEPEPELEPLADAEDETDISVPPASVADLEHAARQAEGADADSDEAEDITDAGDEDMSLLLVERDQTNLTSPKVASDSRQAPDQEQALRDDSGVADASSGGPSSEGVTQTSTTATTGIAQDTQTGVTARTETTSTRTYAPDNYDRTLMRLPSDDASKLFAGMKSDSDVVMTPDYAKKVFHSKSSAQRLQSYKIYSGIAVVILLAVGIYGLFEFQDQSSNIDASLRPLKNDPMPGIIRPEKAPEDSGLFGEVEITERTLDIIESADEDVAEMAPDTGVIAEESVSEEVVSEESVEADAGASVAQAEASGATIASATTQADVVDAKPVDVVETPSQSRIETGTTTESASLVQPEAAGSDSETASSTLEISSSQRLEQKSVWLREAYAAYQAGNDELAMSLYNKVLEIDPQNRNSLLARAAIHAQNSNSRDAIRDYQTLLLANPRDSLAMASLIAVANYSPQETETQLKLMIRDEPDSPYLNFALANAYGAQNRWREAQGHYFRALENNPADPNYAYNLAVSLEHISQHRAAISYYRRALDNFNNGLATFSREVVDQRLEVLGKL